MSRNVIAGDREVWRSGPVTAVRYGKVVTVYLPSGSTVSGLKVGQQIAVATLPVGWRPAMTCVATGFTDALAIAGRIVGKQDGQVLLLVSSDGCYATDSGMVIGTSMMLTFVV